MESKFCDKTIHYPLDDLEKLPNPKLPVLFTAGTHYDVGYTIGHQFSKQIQTFCADFPEMKTNLLPYYDCREGRGVYEGFLNSCSEMFPQYLEEIRGMSLGSGVAFEKLFLLNCLNEMVMLGKDPTKFEDKVAGCTAVYINQPDLKILAHNEDHSPYMQAFAYVASLKIDDDDVLKNTVQESREYITAYCYPGFLPGGTFGFNNHGMVFTCNGLYPTQVIKESIPRRFIDRSLLSASSAAEAVHILERNTYGMAYGVCCNMASSKDKENMWALEVGPKHQHYLHTIPTQMDPLKDSHFIHVNAYQFIQVEEIDAVRLGSTANRYKRAIEMPAPKSIRDLCTILGDTANENYPIFRSPRPTDRSQTLATAVFNILENKMDIYLKNPKESKVPSFYLPLNII